MGSIVLSPSPSHTSSVPHWLVIDGQQRLTTLSILLCAIRDYAEEIDEELARNINSFYLKSKFNRNVHYKLVPTQIDRPSWNALVDKIHNTGGEDGIGVAYNFFRTKVAELAGSGYFEISEIEEAITTRLAFVEICTHEGDNAYRIFESLNDRGLKLTQGDLLRNYLFMRLSDRADRVYGNLWLPMQKMLTDQELVDLIWFDLILRGVDHPRLGSAYATQKNLLEAITEEDDIEAWISDLHYKAMMLRRVVHPNENATPELREALDRLQRWGSKTVHPVSLLVVISHDKGFITAQQASESLRILESYMVRQMLVGSRSTGNNIHFNNLAKMLGKKLPVVQNILPILSGQRRRFPTDEKIREALKFEPFYYKGRKAQQNFVLQSIEESFANSEPVDYTRSPLTVEHLLPQTLNEEWIRTLESDLGEYDSAAELHQALLHTLGNLTLSAYNGKLSNKSFREKSKILAASGLAMNKEISNYSSWGREQIEHRSELMIQRVLSIWPGPLDSEISIDKTQKIALMKQVLGAIPRGRWSSYGDIGQAVGVHHNTIGKWLSSIACKGGHRVLRLDGSHSNDARIAGYDSVEQISEELAAEGIIINGSDVANKKKYISGADLAKIAGIAPVEDPALDPFSEQKET